MITRRKFSPEFKRNIGMEVASGISTAGAVSKREGIAANTIYKWRDSVMNETPNAEETKDIEYKLKIKELEEIINGLVVENHILKKTQKIMAELKKQERLSGSISPQNLASK